MKTFLTTVLLFITIFLFAQGPSVKMPDLDTGKKSHKLEFSKDSDNEQLISAYASGKLKTDSLFFKAKISPVVERVMVTVLLKNKEHNAKIEIVKKNWKDVKRSSKTKNGLVQMSFDTADEFGVIISSSERNVEFDLAVWRGGEIIPKAKKLFYQLGNTGASLKVNSNNNDDSNSMSLPDDSNSYSLIIVIVLIIIAILLVLLLLKNKKNKTIGILVFIFASQTYLSAQIIADRGQRFARSAQRYVEEEFKSKKDFAENVRELVTGGGAYDFLGDDDSDDVIEEDPNGQPKLPSSCLSSYTERADNPRKNNSESEPEKEVDDKYEGLDPDNLPNSTVSTDPQNPAKGPDDAQDDSDKLYQLPLYDLNGKLVNPRDYVGAPLEIHPDTETAFQNPFIQGDVTEGRVKREPKYDDSGHLKNPGDYPDAPEMVDVSTGMPLMNPFIEGSAEPLLEIVRQPKYDKDGNLIDPGDYPDAPQNIDPITLETLDNPFTGEVSEERRSGNNPAKEDSESKEAAINDKENLENDEDHFRKPTGSRNNNEEERIKKEEACACLKEAYKLLDRRRFNLEKLRVISSRIKRQTDYAIKFGDDVSVIHGVSGLTWQAEKKGILASLRSFNKTYDNKYEMMIEDLHEILIEIDRCETLLGFENWYSTHGFIYYTFIKDKYKRK